MKDQLIWLGLLTALLIAAGCATTTPEASETSTGREASLPTSTPVPATQTPTLVPPISTPGLDAPTATPLAEKVPDTVLADVISVELSGEPGAYRLAVGIKSPDTGCDQYADWWEVVSESGELLYRRVLLHSHVDEQPFVRSGGPVDVEAGGVVWVRAHMSTGGYGGVAFKGSARDGFVETVLHASFATDLESELPLPDGCAF